MTEGRILSAAAGRTYIMYTLQLLKASLNCAAVKNGSQIIRLACCRELNSWAEGLSLGRASGSLCTFGAHCAHSERLRANFLRLSSGLQQHSTVQHQH